MVDDIYIKVRIVSDDGKLKPSLLNIRKIKWIEFNEKTAYVVLDGDPLLGKKETIYDCYLEIETGDRNGFLKYLEQTGIKII